jgi:hypothetical protein
MARYSTRDCTTDYKRLDVRVIKRKGCLVTGWSGNWQWSRGGERIGWIQFEVQESQIILRYRTREGGGEWQDKNYPVSLAWSRCHFGGHRAWFLCPVCGRRVAILYGGGVFACRRCRDLAYESQREAPYSRALSKAQAIHQKLGGSGVLGDGIEKPKRMHWKTYSRLVEQMNEADSRAVPPWLIRRFL